MCTICGIISSLNRWRIDASQALLSARAFLRLLRWGVSSGRHRRTAGAVQAMRIHATSRILTIDLNETLLIRARRRYTSRGTLYFNAP